MCAYSWTHYFHDSPFYLSTCPPRYPSPSSTIPWQRNADGRCRLAATAAAAPPSPPLSSHLGRRAGVFPIKLIAPTNQTSLPPFLTSLCTGFLPQFRFKGNKPPLPSPAGRGRQLHEPISITPSPSPWSILCTERLTRPKYSRLNKLRRDTRACDE